MGVPVYKRILDLFEAEGVNTLFGIPDPNFVHMFSEADARGWSVVAPHHELSAGFMAEAASRMTGKPGLCIGTLGPGVANIAGAMMCAYVENSPVIFLGGQRARITAAGAPRPNPIRPAGGAFHPVGEVQQLDRVRRPDRRDRP
jgi:acetolactate synthase I/II/III large subunit